MMSFFFSFTFSVYNFCFFCYYFVEEEKVVSLLESSAGSSALTGWCL